MNVWYRRRARRLVVIGGPIFAQIADSGAQHFLVVTQRFAAALELPRDGFLLVDEENHDVNGGMPEMNAERRAEEFTPQRVHLVDQEFQTLDLHVGAREAVDDDAVVILLSQQLDAAADSPPRGRPPCCRRP